MDGYKGKNVAGVTGGEPGKGKRIQAGLVLKSLLDGAEDWVDVDADVDVVGEVDGWSLVG